MSCRDEKEKPSKKGLSYDSIATAGNDRCNGSSRAVDRARHLYVNVMMSATGMAVVFSIVKYFNDRQERKGKK